MINRFQRGLTVEYLMIVDDLSKGEARTAKIERQIDIRGRIIHVKNTLEQTEWLNHRWGCFVIAVTARSTSIHLMNQIRSEWKEGPLCWWPWTEPQALPDSWDHDNHVALVNPDGALEDAASIIRLLCQQRDYQERIKQLRRAVMKKDDEINDLHEKLAARKDIDRAKGFLMDTFGMTESTAYERMRKQAMDSQSSMRDIARQIMALRDVTET